MTLKNVVGFVILFLMITFVRLAGVASAHEEGDDGNPDDLHINETVHVPAGELSHSGAEGWFREPPNCEMDQIHVTNPCVKGLDAGPYKDPIDDCADVYLKSAEPVIAEVEGRLGVGAMYWVTVITVPCKGRGSGPAKEPEVLRADVEDIDLERVLTLWDENSCRKASDRTDPVDPISVVYCSARPSNEANAVDRGSVRFKLSTEAGDYRWKITNKRTNTATSGILYCHDGFEAIVEGLPPDRYRLEVTCPCKGQDDFRRTIDFTVFAFAIKYPHGNPAKSATDWNNRNSEEANSGNEFTFNRAGAPGIGKVTVPCVAEISPADVADDVKAFLRWHIEDLKDVDANDSERLIRATWTPHAEGDPHTGKGLTAIALYTTTRDGLPRLSSAFGRKAVSLTTDDGACVGELGVEKSTNIEIFYPDRARNHAGGLPGTPNWFHYWMQARPQPNVLYTNAPLREGKWLAATGMFDWKYEAPGPGVKTRILVSPTFPSRTVETPYGVGEPLSGIDLLLGSVIHEEKHVAQIAAADRLMPASNRRDTFRYGWSWNQLRHNHWKKNEPNGAWGRDNFDDDRNRTKDDAAPVPPFEPGWPGSDDQNLDDGRGQDWPKAWAVPVPFAGDPSLIAVEVEAVRHANDTYSEHNSWKADWAAPGKQHRTNQVAND